MMDAIKTRLREIFVQALRLSTPATEIGDSNLVSTLGIDSINSLEILIWVEDDFKIKIEDEDLSPQLIDSLDTLATYIAERRKDLGT